MLKNLSLQLPYYVTRPHGANQETMQFSMNAYFLLITILIIWINVFVWGIIGLITAVKVVF